MSKDNIERRMINLGETKDTSVAGAAKRTAKRAETVATAAALVESENDQSRESAIDREIRDSLEQKRTSLLKEIQSLTERSAELSNIAAQHTKEDILYAENKIWDIKSSRLGVTRFTDQTTTQKILDRRESEIRDATNKLEEMTHRIELRRIHDRLGELKGELDEANELLTIASSGK